MDTTFSNDTQEKSDLPDVPAPPLVPTVAAFTSLEPDRDQISRFVQALFCHAAAGGHVTLRTFTDKKDEPPFNIEAVCINTKGDLKYVVDAAVDRARRAANHRTRKLVFCPPVAVFSNAQHAGEKDLSEGVAISVECDAHAQAAREKLEGLLGPATVVVQSGGVWTNPNTGKSEPKLHLHWRLAKPATGDDLTVLKAVRRAATELVGGDKSNIPATHPIRWPGSWHRKGDPVLCSIEVCNPDREIDLDDAVKKLGVDPKLTASGTGSDDNPFEALANSEKTAPIEQVLRALAAIPNDDDVDWAGWNKIGMAIWAATNGSNDGLDAFMTWSRKHRTSNNDLATKRRWGKISQCPPTDIGAGYLFRLAKEADPHWNDGPAEQQEPHLNLVSDNVVALPRTGSPAGGSRDYITRLNRDHGVVLMEGQVLILHEQGGKPHFISPDHFHLWYANDRVEIEEKKIPVSRLWITSPWRRQYSRVVFDPHNTDPKCYNMWCGFSVKPDPTKSCKKFLAHMRDNICSGVDEHYQWLQAFLAHIVQKPEEKSGVALVLRGEEGVGKGYFANVVGRLFAHHYVVLSQSTQLTGRFNSHFQRALLVFVDEGFWAGDKAGAGALYNLVTEPYLTIEGKHRDAFMVKSLVRLIMASNEKWVVPAGVKARRWGVLDVAPHHANDRAYFAEIDSELRDGGLAGLMHHLMAFDLSSVDVYTAPKTKALLEQKDETLPPHAQWWVETLMRGSFRYPSEDQDRRGQIDETTNWPGEIVKRLIWEAYALWMKQHNIRSRLLSTQVLHQWMSTAGLLDGAAEHRPAGGDRRRVIVLPELKKCRDAFDTYVGQPRDWPREE